MVFKDFDAILFPANRGANIAARAGYPSIVVPGGFFVNPPVPPPPLAPPTPFPPGFNARPAPYGVTFTGPAFSEGRLIGFAYAFEQATHHRTPPDSTAPLPTDVVHRDHEVDALEGRVHVPTVAGRSVGILCAPAAGATNYRSSSTRCQSRPPSRVSKSAEFVPPVRTTAQAWLASAAVTFVTEQARLGRPRVDAACQWRPASAVTCARPPETTHQTLALASAAGQTAMNGLPSSGRGHDASGRVAWRAHVAPPSFVTRKVTDVDVAAPRVAAITPSRPAKAEAC